MDNGELNIRLGEGKATTIADIVSATAQLM